MKHAIVALCAMLALSVPARASEEAELARDACAATSVDVGVSAEAEQAGPQPVAARLTAALPPPVVTILPIEGPIKVRPSLRMMEARASVPPP